MSQTEHGSSPEELAQKRDSAVKKLIANLESFNCVYCLKWKGGSTEHGWDGGFCGEECRKKFFEADPQNEMYLKAAETGIKTLQKEVKKIHDSATKELLAHFENHTCPNCDKKVEQTKATGFNGFCGSQCYRNFVRQDSQNERYLQEALGTSAHDRHLSAEAKEMTAEFNKLSQKTETREKVPVERKEEEKIYKKAA